MPTDDEVTLTLADMEDAEDFDERWEAWEIRHAIPLDKSQLKTICRLWFGRGIERGSLWASGEVDRQVRAIEK